VTRSPGEEIPEVASELQPLGLASQPTGQTGIDLETDSHTVASAPDQVNVAQEEPTSFPLPLALVTTHEGISSTEQRDEHRPSRLADQEANQAGSSSEVTGSPGEEIPELQTLDLAGQPTGQTGINLETDSRTLAVRVE
jgi:hypothetical protein